MIIGIAPQGPLIQTTSMEYYHARGLAENPELRELRDKILAILPDVAETVDEAERGQRAHDGLLAIIMAASEFDARACNNPHCYVHPHARQQQRLTALDFLKQMPTAEPERPTPPEEHNHE